MELPAVPRHLLTIEDLGKEGISRLLERAGELAQGAAPQHQEGRILGLFFFQPSTRTRFGFAAAMARLGGTSLDLGEVKQEAGMSRAESLEDTIRSVAGYVDMVVLRHPSWPAVERAAALSPVPVINGGSGSEHHPTQALIDLFAIQRHFGRLEGLRIGLVGDLARSRSARSLLGALAHFPPEELRLMAPEDRQPPEGWLAALPRGSCRQLAALEVARLDVLCVAGLPEGEGTERLGEEVRRRFRLTRERAQQLDQGSLVLDPLPRIDEIDPGVDELPQAGYFRQSGEGVFVRMGVVEGCLGSRRSASGPSQTSAR